MNATSPPHPHRWLAFTAIIAVSLMDLLDATVANVAGPAIQADLGGSHADVQWIAAGYTLATGWRSIFLVNVPIAAIAFAVGLKHLPEGAPGGDVTRLDLSGVALATTGSFLLVFPLVQGREHGWPAWTFAMLAGAGLVIAAFAFHQARRKRTGGTPLVGPSLFRKRSYVTGVSFAIVFFAAIGGFTLAVSAFLQVGLGFTAEHAGLTMATWAVGAFVGTGFGAMATARLGRRVLQIGLVLMGTGLVALHAALGSAGVGVSSWDLALPLVVYGVGMGMIFAPLYDIALGDVEMHEVGSASGVQQAIQQLGVSLGVAVIGTVFFGRIAGEGAIDAARWAVVATIGLSVVALALTTRLPRREGARVPVPATA